MYTVSSACQSVLDLLAASLFGHPLPTNIHECDIPSILEESRQQAVVGLVSSALLSACPQASEEAFTLVYQEYQRNLRHNHQIWAQHFALDRILRETSIPYCILKGCASAYYYGKKQYLRAMGDVDFLIQEKDIPAATAYLEQAGYTPWKQNHICHIVFRKEKSHLEMHFEVAGIPYGKPGDLVRHEMQSLWATTCVKTFLDEGKLSLPDDYHHGLILLLHMQHHTLECGIGLRHLCDWAVFVYSLPRDLFPTLFEEKLTAIGLYRFAQMMALVSVRLLGLPYQSWMGEMSNPLIDQIAADIIAGGNFGRKDEDRKGSSFFLSNHGKNGTQSSPIKQACLSAKEALYTNHPYYKQNKWLTPIGIAMLVLRHLFRVCFGKSHRMLTYKSISTAEQRKKIYEGLNVFNKNHITKSKKQKKISP